MLKLYDIQQACMLSCDAYSFPNRIFDYDIQDDLICIRRVNDTVSIAFRGTKTYDDWMTNFMCSIRDGVHEGFLNILKPYIDIVLKYLEIHSFDHVLITGHSSGGALASLLHFILKRHNIKCITFGTPFISDTYMHIHGLFNIVLEHDAIPRITEYLSSVCHISSIYHPVGTYIEIGEQYISVLNKNEIYDVSKWINSDILTNIYVTYVHHSMQNYIDVICK